MIGRNIMGGMFKHSLIGAGVLLVAGSFIFGRDVFSYAKTWGSSVRNYVKAEVPLEFEVQRAREMVEELVPDIRDCMHVIAEQQVDIEYRTADVNRRTTALGKQKNDILALRSDLGTGKSTFRYASRTYTSDEVKRDLALRFEQFKFAEESIGRDRQIVEARDKTLRANEQKLDTLLDSKKELEVQLEQLEARLKTVRAAEAASELEFDDTQLARAKKLIRDLNRQLDVKDKLLASEGKFSGLIPVEAAVETAIENVSERIDEYFDTQTDVDEDDATIGLNYDEEPIELTRQF